MNARTGTLLRAAAVAAIVGLGAWYFAPAFGQSGLFVGLAGSVFSLAGMVLLEYYGPRSEEEDGDGDGDKD